MVSLDLELNGILPPTSFQYRAKVLLIVFDSLHLGSDGDWDSCPQVFFVQHLGDKKACRTERAVNQCPLLWSSWLWEGGEEEELETGKGQSFNLEGNGLQEGAAEMKTLKRFCYVCCLNVCSIGSKEHYKGRNQLLTL